MAIELSCRCGADFVLPPALAGQQARCPSCSAALSIPALPKPEVVPDEPRFAVVRVDCPCGRRVAAPAVRLRSGQARCPSCDKTLV